MRRKRDKVWSVWDGIKIVIILVVFIVIGQSDKAADIIEMLPFAESYMKLFSLGAKVINGNYNIGTETYKHIMVSMMDGCLSFVIMHVPPINWIVYGIVHNDDPYNDADDFTRFDKGPNTTIRYFFIGLVMTALASFLYELLITQQKAAQLFHIPFTVSVVVLTVVILVLSVVKNMLSSYHGNSFFLIRGGRLHVNMVGFTIYSIVKDVISTALRAATLVLFFSFLQNPQLNASLFVIVLILLGIEYMIGAVFL